LLDLILAVTREVASFSRSGSGNFFFAQSSLPPSAGDQQYLSLSRIAPFDLVFFMAFFPALGDEW